MSSRQVALSTTDNPYNPITQYDEWEQFDQDKGYLTSSYLDRICHTTLELGEDFYDQDIEDAVDEAVKYDLVSWFYPNVHYMKVVVED